MAQKYLSNFVLILSRGIYQKKFLAKIIFFQRASRRSPLVRVRALQKIIIEPKKLLLNLKLFQSYYHQSAGYALCYHRYPSRSIDSKMGDRYQITNYIHQQ